MSRAFDQVADWVEIGRVGGAFGIKGWVRVFPYTRERDGVLNYRTWYLQSGGAWLRRELEQGRRHGAAVVAKLAGCDDRTAAEQLAGVDVAVRAEQLQAPGDDEFYWRDLVGLEVVNTDGASLGKVREMMETGANDVMVLAAERVRLVPFTRDAVKEVDLERGLVRVDWDAEF